jgi:hypothetical protein
VDDSSFTYRLHGAAERLLQSDLYYSRLRRALINGCNPKILEDFLVIDEICLVAESAPGLISSLQGWRFAAFAKALESARRKIDVRSHSNVEKLYVNLLDRQEGETAEQVLDAVYGKPKKKPTPFVGF